MFHGRLLILDPICQCSKNYGNPSLVTRLKDAPNMVDPTGIKRPVSSLKKKMIPNFSRQTECSTKIELLEVYGERNSCVYPYGSNYGAQHAAVSFSRVQNGRAQRLTRNNKKQIHKN